MHALPVVQNSRWELNERALLIHAFRPLYVADDEQEDPEPWDTLLLTHAFTQYLSHFPYCHASSISKALLSFLLWSQVRPVQQRLYNCVSNVIGVGCTFGVRVATVSHTSGIAK